MIKGKHELLIRFSVYWIFPDIATKVLRPKSIWSTTPQRLIPNNSNPHNLKTDKWQISQEFPLIKKKIFENFQKILNSSLHFSLIFKKTCTFCFVSYSHIVIKPNPLNFSFLSFFFLFFSNFSLIWFFNFFSKITWFFELFLIFCYFL